jgi:hypothetical protein
LIAQGQADYAKKQMAPAKIARGQMQRLKHRWKKLQFDNENSSRHFDISKRTRHRVATIS